MQTPRKNLTFDMVLSNGAGAGAEAEAEAEAEADARAGGNSAYLGLGSNLGDRVQNLLDVKSSLASVVKSNALRASSIYWSSPVGYADQPGFLNQVLELRAECSLRELFGIIQEIELQLGRQRDPNNQNAPRVIDVDLLLFETVDIKDNDLQVPHPRLTQRLFVVDPLLELNPHLRLPDGSKLIDIKSENSSRGIYSDQHIYRLK